MSKQFYTIFFERKSYNPHISYAQNQNRYVGSKHVDSFEDIIPTIREIEAMGHTFTSVYNHIGKKINIAL